MQNYEIFMNTLQPLVKAVKDATGATVRLQKAVAKNMENGNLTEARKNLAALLEAIDTARTRTEALQAEIDSFDTQEYFVSGDFTRQLLEVCEEKKIDVKGEKGIYEMFPYKVRILGDDEHPAEVYLDRKKVQSVRPEFVAETIRLGQSKLYSAKFDPASFMNELAYAYELTCLRSGGRIGATQSLSKIYKNLVPMARARKEYDMQAFAFDLARVYEAGTEAWVTKTGDRYIFGTSRDGANAIRVLSRTGVESFINTLKKITSEE